MGNISTCITAALRNEQFFSLSELNALIRDKLEEFARRPFQKKEGSRYEILRDDELSLLAPLPATPYELAEWKQATIQREPSRTLVVREVALSHIHRRNAILRSL